jgi:5'-deoxynucleotidase YfbR-like HD superfamily hydrolase
MVSVDTRKLKEISVVKGDGKIITHTGKWFDVLNPRPEDVDIEDIAHALSLLCRFTGHTSEFYSVAQHCVLVSDAVVDPWKLHGLLHDASEAYLSDIARPIKKHPAFGTFYLEAESRLEEAIYEHFLINPKNGAERVKQADDILLRTEARDLMPENFPVYPGATLTEEIIPWTPSRAKREFIVKFIELNGN